MIRYRYRLLSIRRETKPKLKKQFDGFLFLCESSLLQRAAQKSILPIQRTEANMSLAKQLEHQRPLNLLVSLALERWQFEGK